VRTFVFRWPQGMHACDTRCRALISRGILLGSRNGMLVQHKVDARLQMPTSRLWPQKIPSRANRGQGRVFEAFEAIKPLEAPPVMVDVHLKTVKNLLYTQ
jgi:hypothetical protein